MDTPRHPPTHSHRPCCASAVLATALLAACGGGHDDDDRARDDDKKDPVVAEFRLHDTRGFTVSTASLPFDPLPDANVQTDRWWGELAGSGYRVEVPRNWNGKLVMYAHGYAGTGAALSVTNPPIRRYLVEQGYAWAASSYSKNYYDVRAGIEDTNRLARAFNAIAAQNGRTLATPSRVYLTGTSMGGHIATSAVEEETRAQSVNKMDYAGVTSWCGAVAPDVHQNYFAAYQLAAMQLAGFPATRHPVPEFEAIRQPVRDALFTNFPAGVTPQGAKLYQVVQELTGGPRPIFPQGWANTTYQTVVWTLGFSRASWEGIATHPFQDTHDIVYQLDDNPAQSAEEAEFNRTIFRATADPAEWNPRRPDGLRWMPRVNGQIANLPVVTLSNLADVYVPFMLEQAYKRRADAAGKSQWLVQRVARSTGHCEFTVAEQAEAFKATVGWAENNVKPEGDDVLTRSVIADPKYGCKFTINTGGPDDSPAVLAIRAGLPSCS